MSVKIPERILVVQIGKIGDMVLTTPLFSFIKKHLPHSHLTVLASKINFPVIESNPFIDEILIYKKNILSDLALIKKLFKKINFWIDTKPEYSMTSELLIKILKPAKTIGYDSEKLKFDVDLNNYISGKHAMDINLAPVKFFNNNFAYGNVRPEIFVNQNLNESERERKIFFNISAGKPSRYLPFELMFQIVNFICGFKDYSLDILGVDKDKHLLEKLSEANRKIRIHISDNILKTAGIIADSVFVLTPDTSIVHIASAFNKSQLVFYPNVKWNYERFAPLSDDFEVIFSKSEVVMSGIDIEDVKEKFNKLIGGNAGSRTRVRKEDH